MRYEYHASVEVAKYSRDHSVIFIRLSTDLIFTYLSN